VRWYYSAKDIAEDARSLRANVGIFAANERALSDMYDVQKVGSIHGLVTVHSWREDDLNPPDIEPDTFYIRNIYDSRMKQLSSPNKSPACEICRIPYNPSPAEISSETTPNFMHFCPRPECRRWFHRECLLRENYVEKEQDYVGPRKIRLLAVDPDLQESHIHFKLYCHLRPCRGKMSQVDAGQDRTDRILEELIKGKPDKEGFEGTGLGHGIVQMAMQPIVRAPLNDENRSFSVSGNLRDVVLARRFIFQFNERWHDIVPEVEKMLSELQTKEDGDAILEFNIWDALSARRLLASPYMPFWKKREALLREGGWRSAAPKVFCPNCEGAI